MISSDSNTQENEEDYKSCVEKCKKKHNKKSILEQMSGFFPINNMKTNDTGESNNEDGLQSQITKGFTGIFNTLKNSVNDLASNSSNNDNNSLSDDSISNYSISGDSIKPTSGKNLVSNSDKNGSTISGGLKKGKKGKKTRKKKIILPYNIMKGGEMTKLLKGGAVTGLTSGASTFTDVTGSDIQLGGKRRGKRRNSRKGSKRKSVKKRMKTMKRMKRSKGKKARKGRKTRRR